MSQDVIEPKHSQPLAPALLQVRQEAGPVPVQRLSGLMDDAQVAAQGAQRNRHIRV
ncbi:hypothetical protein D9M69_710460 [compost metagenome]